MVLCLQTGFVHRLPQSSKAITKKKWYGLYDMAGNVSEWIDDTYDETTSSFALDMNPSYKYEAREGDLKIMRRKVIKGGSWKDVGAYLQCGMRDFEYQDVCRPSIGFRCVRTHIGD